MLWSVKNTLEDIGFKINSYDICVTNKEFDGKQCTVAWYVDDNKLSHTELVINEKIEHLKKCFGGLTVTIGKKNTAFNF